MQIGSNQLYSLIIGVQAPAYKASSTVWINPIGITDAANYTPITNSVAPGELVSLFGTFGVSTQVDTVLPIPTTLGGVQVLVNGQEAPVYVVSQNQVSALVPYDVAGQDFATFQVVVNGTKSNLVTVYVGKSAPGIYTQSQNGIGTGAIFHSDYTVVSSASPAKPGEAVLVYVNGLGPVTPGVSDGAAAPSSPLSKSVETGDVGIYLYDGNSFVPASVLFAGLAPGFAGLYQVNFTVPRSGLSNGEASIYFETDEAENAMATISLSGFSGGSIPAARPARPRRSRSSGEGATLSRPRPNSRRALPVTVRGSF